MTNSTHGNAPLDLTVGQQVYYASPIMKKVKTGVVVSAKVHYCGLTQQISYRLRVFNLRYRQQELKEIPASWIRRGDKRFGTNLGNKE